MEVFIFILIICIIFFYYEFKSLKDQTKDLKELIDKNSKENTNLKKEISELKKVADAQFTILQAALASKEEPQKEPEPEPVKPEPKKIFDIRAKIESLDLKTKIKNEAKPFIDKLFGNEDKTQTPPPFTPTPPEVATEKPTEIELEIVNQPTIEAVTEIITEPITEPVEQPIIEHEPIYEIELEIEPKKPIAEKPQEPSALYLFLKKAEKQFADNWTGILGTAIMVLGIGYLSIYTALQVAPIYRLFILWMYASLLMGSFYFLKKRPRWYKTGLWFRSGGTSLFLFGCFGASQVPELAFTNSLSIGYGLIALGIFLNLYIGYIIKQQTFLSFHVILSVLVLCVVPDKMLITFWVAALTCVAGIILSYKEKWEYHLLVVIVSFALFDLWFNISANMLNPIQNRLAILAITLVAGSCLLMQYRNIYANSVFEKSAFITHLTNWILFAICLLFHTTDSKFKSFIFMVAAVLCLLLARNARKKKIYWLYHLDGMIAFVLCALGIILLNDWQVGIDKILTILYALIVICLVIVHKQKEYLLQKIFLGINHFFGLVLVLLYLLMIYNVIKPPVGASLLASAAMVAVIGVGIAFLSAFKKNLANVDDLYKLNNIGLNGLVSMVFSVILLHFWTAYFGFSFYYALLFLAMAWGFAKQKIHSKTFDLGRLFFLVLSIICGSYLIFVQEKSYSDWVFLLGLSAVIAYNWKLKQFFDNDSTIRHIGIFGLNLFLALLVFKYLKTYNIAPILVLLAIALCNHEFLWFNLKKKLLNNQNQTALYLAYCTFAFLSSGLLLIKSFELQTTDIFMACLALSIAETYVLFAKRLKTTINNTGSIWQEYSYINSELVLFNLLLFGFSCLPTEYIAVFLGILAVFAFHGFQKCTEFKYYNNYSFLLLLGSMMTTIYLVLAPIAGVNQNLLYGSQALSILFSILYSYLQYKNTAEKTNTFNVVFPYIQNLWVIVLLFIQVKIVWLPVLFTGLSLLNYGLITTKITKTNRYFVPAICALAIVISLYYSFAHFKAFGMTDWFLQLAAFGLGMGTIYFMTKEEENPEIKTIYQIVLNIWKSLIMLSQLDHKYLPVFWATTALINLYLYHKKTNNQKNISFIYYLLANVHLGVLSFVYYESSFLYVYLLIFILLGSYLYLAYKWIEDFEHKNNFLIFPATLSIGCFLFLTFDKGILTFFWILESLGLLILGVLLKEKFFRYVSLSLVGICVVRLLFFDLSNTNFLIRALVLVGVGVVMIVMNTIFKKYKHRFNERN